MKTRVNRTLAEAIFSARWSLCETGEVSGWMAARSLDAVPTAPGVGDLTQDAQFADVVGIVVGHDQHLPQHGVLVVAWDRAEEVRPSSTTMLIIASRSRWNAPTLSSHSCFVARVCCAGQ